MIDLYQPIMSWKLSWCIHIKYKRQLINAFKHKPTSNGTAVTIRNFEHSYDIKHVKFFLRIPWIKYLADILLKSYNDRDVCKYCFIYCKVG